MKKLFPIFLFNLAFCLNYSLQDINSSSDYFGVNIGPDTFTGQVTLHYFGHQG